MFHESALILKRRVLIFPKVHQYKQKEVFFHLKSLDFKWERYKDLRQYKIGGALGYAHVKQLEGKGLSQDVAASDVQNFKKLLAGRIDIYPCPFLVGYSLIYKLFDPSKAVLFTNYPKPLSQAPMYVMISQKYPNARAPAGKFDKGIKAIRASGRYQRIFDEYLGTD